VSSGFAAAVVVADMESAAKLLTEGLSLLECFAALAVNALWFVVACFLCLQYFAAVVVVAVDSAASKSGD
jgi:hypothetical protein